MQVDPKEAARRLRAWNEYGEGADSGTPNGPGYTHDSLDFQRDLRALLSERDAATARAEAAEASRDFARRCAENAVKAHNDMEEQRDAATAERDRLRAEVADLRESVVAFAAPWAGQWAKDHNLPHGHLHPVHYDILAKAGARMDDFTRAALTSAKEAGE